MKKMPRVKLTLTQADIDVLKSGNKLNPSTELLFEEKGQVDFRFCVIEMSWSDDI